MINRKIRTKKNMTSLAAEQYNDRNESKTPSGPKAEMGECEICWNTFNKSTRQKIQCGKCEMNFCKQCVRKYLMESNDNAHCMNCKVAWDRKFTQESLNKSYYNKNHTNYKIYF